MDYVIFPTQVEDLPVCTVRDGQPVEWQFLPEEASRKVGGERVKYNPRLEFLERLTTEDTVYFPLGGTGDALKVRALQQGAQVHCLPFNVINANKPTHLDGHAPSEYAQLGEKAKDRVRSMMAMAYIANDNPGLYRPYTEVDQSIGALRVYTSQLLAIQDEVRKRFGQRSLMLEREQSYLRRPVDRDDFVYDLVDSRHPEEVLLAYEHQLELAMMRQLRRIPVFTKVLEPVRGIGPRLAARIITPIVTITRFPKLAGFRRYAGWDTVEVGNGTPHHVARRFMRGESAQFHERLRMGLWLFGEQLVRNNSQFRWWYDGYKAKHAGDVGKVLYAYEKDGKSKEAVLSVFWLERRARRYAASKFLTYLWFGWWELEGKTFRNKEGQPFRASDLLHPEDFYPDDYFAPEND